MTTTHHQSPLVITEAPTPTPTRAELVGTITDFCLDLIHHCDGHAFTKGSPALDTLAMYAYGAVHALAGQHQLSPADRLMLGAILYLEFFGQNGSLALANAGALDGAARSPASPRYTTIHNSAAAFRDWQRDPIRLDAGDFRAHLPWPDAAARLLPSA